MLNGRWVRFRAGQDGRCVPLLLDPDREDNAALAEALAGYLRGMGGRPRTEVEEGLEPLVKGEGRAKVARGLAEVLLERCEFEQAGELDPVAVREALFSRAAQRFPVGTREGMTLRGEILADAAAALGSTPAALEAALFADLKGEQRLTAAPPWTGEELLLRYNAAQVQALLLRAESLTVTLSAPPPARVRQLVRYLRFFELLHSVSAAEGTVVFSVDGPASVLEGGRRYGLQMARFFPALLLQERFVAEARIRWPGKRKRLDLVLEPSPRLRSWYPDTGAWIPREITELADRLAAAAGPGWEVRPAEEVVPLGGQTLFVPDLVLAGP
ncbi:MAG: DUF790 family protein, partial [Deltaproteobacteria bacterium]|nr:DUF790 family protein [Deltaproteobacteria bacterium]